MLKAGEAVEVSQSQMFEIVNFVTVTSQLLEKSQPGGAWHQITAHQSW